MKIPIIRHLVEFTEEHDEDFIKKSIQTLEALCDSSSLKDDEIDVIGELLSNMYGAVEVLEDIREGTPKRQALNSFMKRVLGSIDK